MLFIHPDVMHQYASKAQTANQAAVSGLLAFVKYAEKASEAHKSIKPISATDPDAQHSLTVYFAAQDSNAASSAPKLRSFKYDLRAPASLLYRTEVASRKRRDGQLQSEWLHTAMTAVQGMLTRLGSDVQLQLAETHEKFLQDRYSERQGREGDKSKDSPQQVQPSQFAARRMTLQHAYMNDPNTQTDWMHSRRTPLHAASPLSERQVDVIVGRFVSQNVDVSQLPHKDRSAALARLAGCCVRHFAALRLHEAPWRSIRVVMGGAYLAQTHRYTLHVPAGFRDAEFVLWAQKHYAAMAPALLSASLSRGGLQVASQGAAGNRPPGAQGQSADSTARATAQPTSKDTPRSRAADDSPLRSFVAELRKRRAAAGGGPAPQPER